MKRIILVLFVALFCEAAFAQDNSAPKRSSFYVNADLGANLTSLNRNSYDGTGFGFVGEVSLGMLIKEAATLQGSFGFYTIDGDYDLPKQYDKYGKKVREINALVVVGGFGTTVFPFSRSQNPFLHGTFFGAKALMGLSLISDPTIVILGNSRSDDLVMGIDLELGKDWEISERFYMGIGIRWRYLGIVDSDGENYHEDYDSNGNHINSLQVLFRINRK